MGKTVFILGAGSNHEYGFPLGLKMLEDTVRDIENTDSVLYKLYLHLSDKLKFKESFVEFGRVLGNSGLNSIDEFVLQHPEYDKMAKIAISYYIIESERKSADLREKNHWYKFLWDQIYTRDFKDFPKKDIGIVTFNYDRSFEECFHSFILNTYGKKNNFDDKSISKLMFDKVPIYHVYGKINDLPYENNNNSLKYREDFNIAFHDHGINAERRVNNLSAPIIKSLNNIELILENRQNMNPKLEEIKNLIQESSKIIFLGFAFSDDNMKNLGFERDYPLLNKKYGFWFNYDSLDPTSRQDYINAKNYDIELNEKHYEDITSYLRNEPKF